jgi:L-amino acid N-acyltransferase YncA
MRIRPATPADIASIAPIYRDQVLQGTATWEYDPPDDAEMAQRMQAVLDGGFPYLAAEDTSGLTGYAYASSYRARTGYRFVVEDSVYVRADQRGRGLGKALLTALITACAARGYRQMIAVIGDSANTSSIHLHRACGFETIGVFKGIGFKFDRWLDSMQMQRALFVPNETDRAGDAGVFES